MDPSSSPGQPSQIIGRYALFGALASGGMATVHLGRLLGPAGFSRTVAIKRLHEQFASDPEFVAGFLDEARLAARIRHPNVVPTLDVVATDGQLFLVMEYVQGESVARLLRQLRVRDSLMPVGMAVAIAVGALHGLHAAHEARSEKGEPLHIVHRDVSPQNILVGTDGVARVLDFGVAKAVGRLQTTESGRLKGKVAYMSPEQIHSSNTDRRTDIFAASVVLWEMLVGKRLFDADNEAMALDRVLNAAIPPPSTVVSDLPAAVDAVVLRGLSRDVDARWQTAREMALALEECLTLPSSSQVGSWVESVAPVALAARAERVAEVESATSDAGDRASQALAEFRAGESRTDQGSTRAFGPTPSVADLETGSRSAALSVANTAPPPPAKRRVLANAALAALAAGGGALAVILVFRVFAAPASSTGDAAASRPPASAPRLDALAAPPAPDLTVSAAPHAPSAAPGASTAPPTRTKTPPKPGSFKPPPDCAVPYVRDQTGRKIWKKECL